MHVSTFLQRSFLGCLLLTIGLCTGSCSNSTSPTGYGGVGTGSLTGTVLLRDSAGVPLSSFEGTTVSIEGAALSTTTDSKGIWRIDGIPPGTQVMRAEKPGFGYIREFDLLVPGPGLQFIGQQVLYTTGSSFPIYLDRIVPLTDTSIQVVGTCPKTNNQSATMLMNISTDSIITIGNPKDYQFTVILSVQVLQTILTHAELTSYGFPKGTRIYLSFLFPGGTSYVDPFSDRRIYTTMEAQSNVMSAIAP